MTGAGGRDASRPCLLINPASFRASRLGLGRRAAELAREAGIEVIQLADFHALRPALDQLRARGQAQLWVLAGDGTIQAIAGYLADLPPDDWNPALLPLAGGRANIVPRECGTYPAMPALRRALAAHREGRPIATATLRALRVEQEGSPVRLGFLLAGGVLHEGVRLCSEHRARGTGWLHRSWFADPYTLLKIAVQVWLGRSPLPPYARLDVLVTPGGGLAAPMRMVVATTLELGAALYNPFALRGAGAVRVTAVAAAARRFWRHLPALMGGRFSEAMNPDAGYLSGRCETARIIGATGYALDGECFVADPALPLRLSAGIALKVLKP